MKAETPQPFSKRTPEDIYLEYVNDWLTIERMADNYGRTEEEMKAIIDKGRQENTDNIINNPYKTAVKQ